MRDPERVPRVAPGKGEEPMTSKFRMVDDLGLLAVDRGLGSCKHRSAGCAGCYNQKFFRRFPLVRQFWAKGGQDDQTWESLTPSDFAALRPGRVRLCTRGEPLSVASDVKRIAEWAKAAPHVTLWVPTRGWRNATIKRLAEEILFPLPNVKLLASVDRETVGEADGLAAEGWSTMYFDPDDRAPQYSGRVVRCAKTWKGTKRACRSCSSGCFASGTPGWYG